MPKHEFSLSKLRRNVPLKLAEITEKLLSDAVSDAASIKREFNELLNLPRSSVKAGRNF